MCVAPRYGSIEIAPQPVRRQRLEQGLRRRVFTRTSPFSFEILEGAAERVDTGADRSGPLRRVRRATGERRLPGRGMIQLGEKRFLSDPFSLGRDSIVFSCKSVAKTVSLSAVWIYPIRTRETIQAPHARTVGVP